MSKKGKTITGAPVALVKNNLSVMVVIKARALNPIVLQLKLQAKFGFVDANKQKILLFVTAAIQRLQHEKVLYPSYLFYSWGV